MIIAEMPPVWCKSSWTGVTNRGGWSVFRCVMVNSAAKALCRWMDVSIKAVKTGKFSPGAQEESKRQNRKGKLGQVQKHFCWKRLQGKEKRGLFLQRISSSMNQWKKMLWSFGTMEACAFMECAPGTTLHVINVPKLIWPLTVQAVVSDSCEYCKVSTRAYLLSFHVFQQPGNDEKGFTWGPLLRAFVFNTQGVFVTGAFKSKTPQSEEGQCRKNSSKLCWWKRRWDLSHLFVPPLRNGKSNVSSIKVFCYNTRWSKTP